jgi:tRNA-Thr(GGU) m(6)t(6)A37 methyltransferase TsaA
MQIEPIGWVNSSRTEAIDDDWDAVASTISLDRQRFTPDALRGLEEFSHVDVVYLFHLVEPTDITIGARRPRSNPQWPEVGIFAQRARMRPNRLGVTTCGLLSIDGLDLAVRGLDAMDGSPVLDIKPYMVEFGPRGHVRQPRWSHELMSSYWS